MRLLISIATYNERDNLPPLVAEIHRYAPDADVLIVDDNSPDGTGLLADRLAADDDRVHVLHRSGKLGLGTAILDGIRFAIAHDYDYLLNMDADFSHHPRHLPNLLAGMKKYDIMIGSRYIPGGSTVNFPLSRRMISRTVNLLSRLLLRIPARDASGAFRCYRIAKLREVELDDIISTGYSFQEEMLYRCHLAGVRIGESAIVFEDRRAGRSKVDGAEAIRSLGVLLRLGVHSIFGQF